MPIQGGKLYPTKIKKVIFFSTNPKEDNNRNTKIKKITGSNNHYCLISLNINGINSPIKRCRLTDWIQKQDLTFCCIWEAHL